MSDDLLHKRTSEPPSPNDSNSAPGSMQETRRHRRQNRNRKGIGYGSKLQGACDDLKDHIYDINPYQASSELFTKTTVAIGEYVAREYSGASEFRNALPAMSLPQLNPPTNPTPDDPVALDIWKLDIQEHRKELAIWAKSTR